MDDYEKLYDRIATGNVVNIERIVKDSCSLRRGSIPDIEEATLEAKKRFTEEFDKNIDKSKYDEETVEKVKKDWVKEIENKVKSKMKSLENKKDKREFERNHGPPY